MDAKRSLTWLTCGTQSVSVPGALMSGWKMRQFDYTAPPRFGPPEGPQGHVGILDLTRYPDDGAPHLGRWMEKLRVPYWIGILPEAPVLNRQLAYLTSLYCCDYHTLPMDWERLAMSAGHFWGMAELHEETTRETRDGYQQIALTGDSPTIHQVISRLKRFAGTSEPVVIYGESGTGREAAARLVHEHSLARHGPLVIINCAALPLSLTQTELFGHEKGAFTHATSQRIGRLEAADGGSLLLAGIDELSLVQQSYLLRFLEEGVVERIGSNRPLRINTRLIATASRSLSEQVNDGSFRQDVYFRLGEMAVELPPLRERPEDIPRLVEALLQRLPPHLPAKPVSQAAMEQLLSHGWPGNLRELQNRLHQALLLGEDPQVEPMDLELGGVPASVHGQHDLSLAQFRARAERQALHCSLALTRNNISAAARLLRISRASLYRLIDKYQPPLSDTIHPPTTSGRQQRR